MFDQTPVRPLTLSYKVPQFAGLGILFAMSLMVILRRNIGWRLIQPTKLAAGMILLGFSPDGRNSILFWIGEFGVTGAMLYGLAVIALAFWQYFGHRGRGAFAPDSPHAYHSGDSYLGFLPIQRVYIVAVIEPLLVFFVGWSLFDQVWPLGNLAIWLMVSAAALALFGFREWLYQIHRHWTDHDLKREAEAETIAARGRGKRTQAGQDEPLHTDAGDDDKPYRRRGR